MSAATASSIDGGPDCADCGMSRSAAGLPMSWGKCTERLAADVPDELYAAVTRERLKLGMGEAEYVRYALMRTAMEPGEIRRLHEQRLAVLFPSGQESGGTP